MLCKIKIETNVNFYFVLLKNRQSAQNIGTGTLQFLFEIVGKCAKLIAKVFIETGLKILRNLFSYCCTQIEPVIYICNKQH